MACPKKKRFKRFTYIEKHGANGKMADVVIKKHKNKKKRGKPVVVEFVDPALEDRKVRERKKVRDFNSFCVREIVRPTLRTTEKTREEKRTRGRNVRTKKRSIRFG